ncbi:hypothetical protein BJX61DRAFT_544732 [Aspergillus egyptiacus]|nr:hypothetical protein BJX61DRAFT_544732 [Aspergillus egyptiacus]
MGSIFSASEQPPPPPLPSGWVQKWDHCCQRAYFVQVETGAVRWEYPSDPAGNLTKGEKEKDYVHTTHLDRECTTNNNTNTNIKSPKAGLQLEKPGGESIWAAPDSEIDEVDRII